MGHRLWVVLIVSLVAAACGGTTQQRTVAQAPNSTLATAATTDSTAQAKSGRFSAPKYGLGLEPVPEGFAEWRDTRVVNGPGPNWVHAYQAFRSDATGQQLTIAVTRGKPSELSLKASDGTRLGTESTERVGNYPTYFFDLTNVTKQLQYGWVIAPDVMGWVTSYEMTREATLDIARDVEITDPQVTS